MLIGGLSALFSARPLVNSYQAWAAVRLVERANLELDRNNQEAAYRAAWKAFELSPEHPEVMRMMGNLLMKVPTELNRAAYFFEKLAEKGEATMDDDLALVRCLLMSDRLDEADALLSEVVSEEPDHPSVLHVRADLEARHGRGKQATELLRQAFVSETAPEKRLDLAMVILKRGDGPLVEGAIDAISDLSERKDGTGLLALEQAVFLMAQGRLGNQSGLQVAEKLTQHPGATDRHALMRESVKIMQHPEEKQEIVKGAIRERIGKPIHELVEFFDWLILEDSAVWVLDLLSGEVAMRHPGVLDVYLKALLKERRWRELDEMLAQRDLPLGELRKRLLRVRAGLLTGKDRREMLREASAILRLAKGSGDISAVLEATAIAERLGDTELIGFGLSTLEGSSLLREGALEGRFKLARKNHDFDEMQVIAQRLLQMDPGNQRYREIGLYYDLLMGRRIELVAFRLRELEDPDERGEMKGFLRAFAAYRSGNLVEAVKLARPIDPWRLDQGPRAVLAAILDLGGEPRRAADIASRIPFEMVISPERRFLKAAMAK
jgi:hypothetical protein